MGRKASLLVMFSFLVLLFQVRSGFAWSGETHRVLSQRAAQISQLTTGVLSGLGFQNLETKITGADFNGIQKNQEIVQWIRDGSLKGFSGIDA